MSVFTQFTSGTGGSVPALNQTFLTSGTFTVPISGWYGIFAVGGGGAGGSSAGSGAASPAPWSHSQGGAAAGSAVKIAYLSEGTSLVITLGTGGTGVTANSGNRQTGNAGNATTVIGGSVSLTCNGGAGGKGVLGNTAQNAINGGTATGGDLNWQGGGQATINAAPNRAATVWGGSSVGVFGTGIAANTRTGCGTGSDSGLGYGYVAWGGSTAANIVGNTTFDENSIIAPPVIFGLQMNGKAPLAANIANRAAPIGSGGTGNSAPSSNDAITGGAGGLLGGGGGTAYLNPGFPNANPGASTGGAGGRGGGGGGATQHSYGPGQVVVGGAGGAGFVQIGYLGQ